jgi:hypothetical protein
MSTHGHHGAVVVAEPPYLRQSLSSSLSLPPPPDPQSNHRQHFRRWLPFLSPTFASRYPFSLVPAIHHLCRSHRWLVVAFSARPAAHPLIHQAKIVFMFPHMDLF